jgi:outer membrane lipoprotein carrier protein
MRRLVLLGAALALGSVAPPSRADEAEPVAQHAAMASCRSGAIAAIQRRYESVRDLRARFTQTTRPASLGGRPAPETRSSGQLAMAKPSRIRWSYEEPEPSLVVSDGKTLWIYDPEFGEAQRLPVDGGFLSGAALQFLLGRGEIERDFEVKALACDASQVELEMKPRESTSYEKLVLTANPRSGDVSGTRIVDLLGNVTSVEFSKLEVNVNPPPELFRFDPPEGVRVIDLEKPTP